MKIVLILSFILLSTVSCRQTKDVTCDTGWFSFVGVGFSVADFEGATIRQYQAGTNFGKLLQSGNIDYYLWDRGSVTSDSGNAMPPGAMAVAHEPSALSTTYDYIVSIPAAGMIDTISNAVFIGPTHQMMTVSDAHPAYCVNHIGSYKINGQTVIPGGSGQINNVIYLVK